MLLKCLNYWSAPGGLDNTLEPLDFLPLAARHGFPAVELAVGETGALCLTSTEQDCQEILAAAASVDVKVASLASGLYWSRSVGDADPHKRQQAQDDVERMLQIASWLKVKTLLFIPGAVDVFFLPQRPVQEYQQVLEYAVKGIMALLPAAEAAGVRLGIENVWNRFLLSPTELAEFIDLFNSPWIGAYVDVGNVMPIGYPEQWLRILGHRVVGIHFKDFRKSVGTAEGFVDLLEGDVNWPEVIVALEEIGYDGPVAAEMIPCYKFFPEVRLANTSRAMDAILNNL